MGGADAHHTTALGQTEPAWALALSVVLPLLLWLLARRWLRR